MKNKYSKPSFELVDFSQDDSIMTVSAYTAQQKLDKIKYTIGKLNS